LGILSREDTEVPGVLPREDRLDGVDLLGWGSNLDRDRQEVQITSRVALVLIVLSLFSVAGLGALPRADPGRRLHGHAPVRPTTHSKEIAQ